MRKFQLNERFPGLLRTFCWSVVGAAAFHGAYALSWGRGLIVVYLFALLQIAGIGGYRVAFYGGLFTGMLIAAVRLSFFWEIFSGGAIALWFVYAFWIGLFTLLVSLFKHRLPFPWPGILAPFVWFALEYFRSELYFLKFAWLTPGYAFSETGLHGVLKYTGVYGLGFLVTAFAGLVLILCQKSRRAGLSVLVAGLVLLSWGSSLPPGSAAPPRSGIQVTGVQMEFPSEPEVILRLNEALKRHPHTDLLVLSENTFAEPVPQKVKDWCRKNGKYLVVGGADPIKDGAYFNTAFVVSPGGEIVFRQAKSVPIQFFKDGLPAPSQAVWDSPWGRMGICICYDLSYSRVTDQLVRLGAQALIVPTMDVADWGRAQHQLHGRIAPIRSAEYKIPIFRLASSGISQVTDAAGKVLASGAYPGQGEIISTTLPLVEKASLPWDRPLGLPFVLGTLVLFLTILVRRPRNISPASPESSPTALSLHEIPD